MYWQKIVAFICVFQDFQVFSYCEILSTHSFIIIFYCKNNCIFKKYLKLLLKSHSFYILTPKPFKTQKHISIPTNKLQIYMASGEILHKILRSTGQIPQHSPFALRLMDQSVRGSRNQPSVIQRVKRGSSHESFREI